MIYFKSLWKSKTYFTLDLNLFLQKIETLQTIIEEKDLAREKDVRTLEREKQQVKLHLSSMNDELNALKCTGTVKNKENTAELRSLRGKHSTEWHVFLRGVPVCR